MDVRAMVEAALAQGGYDGLYNPDADCACARGELFPCQADGVEQCHAGYIQPCPASCGEHEFHIAAQKDAGA